MHTIKNLLFTINLLFLALVVHAQTTTNIFGVVIDAQTQEPLIGVNIFVEGTDKGTTTDFDGNYELKNITPGSYNITASYLGFAANTRSNVIIQSKGSDDINFKLTE